MKENEMIHTSRVLIVEGKYDAARLSHLTDAMILLTDGFGIYKDKKRQQLFKALAQKNGLTVSCVWMRLNRCKRRLREHPEFFYLFLLIVLGNGGHTV